MTVALAVVVYVVAAVLNAGGVLALAHWWSQRAAAANAHEKWRASGATDGYEPAPVPTLSAPAAVLGIVLVLLASSLSFLFAFWLGGA